MKIHICVYISLSLSLSVKMFYLFLCICLTTPDLGFIVLQVMQGISAIKTRRPQKRSTGRTLVDPFKDLLGGRLEPSVF